MTLEEIEKELLAIKERNKKVEADKRWETSLSRKMLTAVLTYAVVVLLFVSANITRPFLSALVPALGFLLSTLSFPWFKKKWIETQKPK